MALRGSDEIGVRDPRRISPVLVDDGTEPSGAPTRKPPSAKHSSRPRRSGSRSSGSGERLRQDFETRITARDADASGSDTPRHALGAEPTDYVQVNVPGELQHRVESVAFEMSESHPRLAKHQLIIGALIWRYVSYTDDEVLRSLGALLDRYARTDLAEAPLDRRLAARVPASLKRQARGAALRLRQAREDASLRLIVSALVSEHVRSQADDPNAYEALVAAVGAYRDALRAPVT